MVASKSGEAQIPADLESETLLTGRGQYTDDVTAVGALHAVFLRSPVAHAIVTRLDVRAAAQAPGVIAVLTAEELADAGCGDMDTAAPLIPALGAPPVPYERTPKPVFVKDRIRHVGELVAMVVADTAAAAQDAAELIELEFDMLPAAVATRASGEATEAPVWDSVPTNRSYTWSAGDRAAVDGAFSTAAHQVSVSLRNQRLAGSPLEPRAAVASFDAESGRYTLFCGSQGTAGVRQGVAGVLGVSEEAVRVISGHVGGGFGLKAAIYPEYVAVMVASRLVGRPVRWTSTRAEALQSDLHGRDSTLAISAAFDAECRITGISVDTVSNLGAYIQGVGPWVQSIVVGECIAGPYLTPAIALRSEGVLSNSMSVTPYRGAGRPEAAYMLERMMDRAARQIGIDRIDLRRRNLIPRNALPYTGPLGQTYDSGDFVAVLDKALEASDWPGIEARKAGARARGLYRGIGCAMFLETAGPFLQEPVDLRVTEDGVIEVRVAAVSNGQRHVSTFTDIICRRLGIEQGKVKVIAGDSDDVPAGPPSVGSRTAMITGSAVASAVDSAIERGRAIVVELTEGRHNDILFENGAYSIVATGERIEFLDLPRRMAEAQEKGRSFAERLDGVEVYSLPRYTYPNGCHVCEVEVDPETGVIDLLNYVAVDDCGTVLNPPVVAGQVIGGIAQGLGQALMEELVYGEDGQLLTGSFMDYAMPRADDMPKRMTVIDLPDPSPSTLLGAKGVGEAGTTGSLAAIVNAVEDALQPLGVTDIQMPLTPYRVWEAISRARV